MLNSFYTCQKVLRTLDSERQIERIFTISYLLNVVRQLVTELNNLVRFDQLYNANY